MITGLWKVVCRLEVVGRFLKLLPDFGEIKGIQGKKFQAKLSNVSLRSPVS